MNNIICLKWGDKYSSNYVNVLHNMCRRHNSSPFNFICLTDNAYGLSPQIIQKPLPKSSLKGWWYKPYVFSRSLDIKGNTLFLDLDLVIHSNIEKLWEYEKDSFVIIRDFTRHMNPAWQKFNSSVFRFNPEDYYWIWDTFENNHKQITTKFYGDQDYLYSILQHSAKMWPDEWIQSYKWEMRDKSELLLRNGKRNFSTIGYPRIHSDSCIAVFHGDPNPDQVRDPWVVENWK